MWSLRRILGQKLSSDRADASVGSIVSFGAAIALWVVVVPKLVTLGLTEPQLIFGLLLLLIASLLCVALGLLLPVYQAVRAIAKEKRD